MKPHSEMENCKTGFSLSPFTSLSALIAVRRSTLGLSPVGDSAILPVRPALLLPWEEVRVGCSTEPFLCSQKKATALG